MKRRVTLLACRMAATYPVLILAVLPACRSQPAAPPTIRLVDVFRPETVQGGVSKSTEAATPRAEWQFDGAPAAGKPTRGWSASSGVAGLSVRGGRLVGKAATAVPILHVEREANADPDLLHAIEIRLRISAGRLMSIAFSDDEKPDLARAHQVARDYPTEGSTPIVAGDEMRTYTFRRPETFASSEIRHVFLRPTNVAGATFEIESVRLIFRKEHLASVPSGISWQGLSGVFREAIVARSPETLRLEVTLPKRPWLDLAVGTIEDGSIGFRVTLGRGGKASGSQEQTLLLERTTTAPHRWEQTPIDLGAFAGEKVTLSLSLHAEQSGAIGIWGSPVIRSRGAEPRLGRRDQSDRDPPQGIVILWADTLRSDHLDAYSYGRKTAPVVARMASEGTLFETCVTQATWTKVSTPSLLTSVYPTSHGVKSWDDRIPSSATTLAEVYRDAGYATLSFASNNFTGQLSNLHQGFEQVFEDSSLPDRKTSKTARPGMDVVLPWIEAHRDVPFLVFMSILDPHDPYKPYAPYDSLWADSARAKEHERQTNEARKFIAIPFLKRFGMPSREELLKAGIEPAAYIAHDIDWYDGSIRGMDVEVGRLLERLRALGLERKTLVVFTSDHGEEFLEHGRTFHGQSAYGELNRVPLVLWQPGSVPEGMRIRETVETIDIMPTLLAMSDLPSPAEMQGQSLLPLLAAAKNEALASRAVWSLGAPVQAAAARWTSRAVVTEKWAAKDDLPPLDTDSVAIMKDGWKLIHNPRRHPPTPEYELYDFRKDPLDRKDLAAQHPDVIRDLARELQAWRSKVAAARLKPDAEAAKAVSGEELERLRALGYVQ